MKKILTLLLCGFSIYATAQKIALLEPREGDGSTQISGMEKAMLRGELRKAIVNHTGFEAFTRADIDQLMKEQDFQRTGNVSEADIHKMGEMSGADYICVSTLNKSEDEFYLEAYLINIETGAISNPASQYGELINGKLANMLPVCQALAQELLGITTPIAQPVMTTQPTAQKPASTPAPSKSDPSPNPRPQVHEQGGSQNGIGELMTFSDGSKGIVFYKTEDGQHGLVVSLDETSTQWENQKRGRDCHDITALRNEDNSAKYMTFRVGMANTNAILQQLGNSQAPAAAWCKQHGEEWYLPSVGELWYLFSVANGGSTPTPAYLKGRDAWNWRDEVIVNGPVNKAIKQAGGIPIQNEDYWTSTERDNDDVAIVDAEGDVGTSEKPDFELVRAVRAF